MTDLAVDCALRGEPGVIGHDEERGDELRAIEFDRIKGGKPFDIDQDWFTELLAGIGQPVTEGRRPLIAAVSCPHRELSDRRRSAAGTSAAIPARTAPTPRPVAAPVTQPGTETDPDGADGRLLGHHRVLDRGRRRSVAARTGPLPRRWLERRLVPGRDPGCDESRSAARTG